MYYVYILKSDKTAKLYKGSTGDLKARLLKHNRGDVLSTKAGRPWKLIYYEAFINKTDALREENFLKSGKGRERISYLFSK
ncbi:MAG: GIY-YIG nuclease family protein [Patescibacteria group bacterium]